VNPGEPAAAKARTDQWLGEQLDRIGIGNVLAQHARGIDRADQALLQATYHEDGWVDYGSLQASPEVFAAAIAGMHRGAPLSLHRPSNVWIQLRGDQAVSESYVMAWVTLATDAEPQPHLVGGRYLDRHTRRDGMWRMQQRNYVLDWIMQYPTPDGSSGNERPFSLQHSAPRGGHYLQDPGNALLSAYAATRGSTIEGSTMEQTAALERVIAHQAIVELGCRYARGLDRGDPELILSAFHDDATIVSGVFNGPVRDFAREIGSILDTVSPRVAHTVSNHWVDVKGATAVGESYVVAYQQLLGEPLQDVLTGGRYIDRYERRQGRWGIVQRTFVMDWSTAQEGKDLTASGMFEAMVQGSRDRSDPVYALWSESVE